MSKACYGRWRAQIAAAAVALLAVAAHSEARLDIRPVDAGGLRKLIRAHRGKVVLVNLWATDCPPCLAEFRDLARLDRERRAQGLRVLALAMDPPAERARVDAFVRDQAVEFPILVRRPGDPRAVVAPLDRNWRGVVPVTYVFDRGGRRAGKPLEGLTAYEQFDAAVKAPLSSRR